MRLSQWKHLMDDETGFGDDERVTRWLSTLREQPSDNDKDAVGRDRSNTSRGPRKRSSQWNNDYQDESVRQSRKHAAADPVVSSRSGQCLDGKDDERSRRRNKRQREHTPGEDDNGHNTRKRKHDQRRRDENVQSRHCMSTRLEGSEVNPESNVNDTSGKYARRPRHKTKPERYEFKADTKEQKRPERRGAGKGSIPVKEKFQAPNVDTKRLTLRPHTGPGLFAKGRSSTSFPREGVPDLTFSNMSFLEKRVRGTAQTPKHIENTRKWTHRAPNDGRAEFFSQRILYEAGDQSQAWRHHQHTSSVSSAAEARFPGQHSRESHNQHWRPDSRLSKVQHYRQPSYEDTLTSSRTTNGTYISWSMSPPRHLARSRGQQEWLLGRPAEPNIFTPMRKEHGQNDSPQLPSSSIAKEQFLQDLTTEALLGGVEAFSHKEKKRYSLDELKKMASGRQSYQDSNLPYKKQDPASSEGVAHEPGMRNLYPVSSRQDTEVKASDDAGRRAQLQSPINIEDRSGEDPVGHDNGRPQKQDKKPTETHLRTSRVHTLADFCPSPAEDAKQYLGDITRGPTCIRQVGQENGQEMISDKSSCNDDGRDPILDTPFHHQSSLPWHSVPTLIDKFNVASNVIADSPTAPDELDAFDAQLLQMAVDDAGSPEVWNMDDTSLEQIAVDPEKVWDQPQVWTTTQPDRRLWDGSHQPSSMLQEHDQELPANSRAMEYDRNGVGHAARYSVEMTPEPFKGFSRPRLLY
ncbi:hypothetical protein ABEF95_012638 [Exophiala dermatitidis]